MGRFKKNIIHNRILKFTFISFIIFILLIGRLFWLQIKNHHPLKTEALKQRGKEVNIYPDRGIIYDVNLIPLTNNERVNTLFVFKDSIDKDQSIKDFILNNTNLSEKQLEECIETNKTIIDIPLKHTIPNPNEKKIFVADKTLRYNNRNILSHVIGYINKSENRGESGIEKVYDEILKKQKGESLFIELDKRENIILGGDYAVGQKTDPLQPTSVKLTIDYHIQSIVESILDEEKANGAVIVADAETGDIKALASRPNFDQEDIDQYLDREDMALYNKGVQVSYPPGSLFKIVVLLTALEEDIGYIDRYFYCKGYEEIGNISIRCSNTSGHGHISFKEAFSKSCNSAFIQLGQELGSDKIINMAKKIGLGNRINIGLLEEIEGNLPSGKELKGPAIGNISIGQGSIETTPIQITNMMLIGVNGGVRKAMTIVDGITTKDGYMIKKFNREKEERVVSKESCQILYDYLINVVEEGTAMNINLADIGGAGGKTGSAQAVLNGVETIHGWFSGFYPIEKPQYVITVIIEEGISGSQSAAPVFEKIIKKINEINR